MDPATEDEAIPGPKGDRLVRRTIPNATVFEGQFVAAASTDGAVDRGGTDVEATTLSIRGGASECGEQPIRRDDGVVRAQDRASMQVACIEATEVQRGPPSARNTVHAHHAPGSRGSGHRGRREPVATVSRS